jgi:molybdopterin-guanine dinucleotide biosynthesis protein A
MGTDKALLQFGGKPLVETALEILRGAGLEAQIAGGTPALRQFAPVLEDATPGRGPLGGICTALASTTAPRAVFLPVDLPLLPSPLIRFLLFHASMTGCAVTLASCGGFVESFPVVLGREALPALTAALNSGERGCWRAFQVAAASLQQPAKVLAVEVLAQPGLVAHPAGLPTACWFANMNTMDDFRAARRCISPFDRVS